MIFNHVACWNGSSWSALGDRAIGAGGWFSQAGGVIGTCRIAKWNGSNWSALGSGMSGIVYAIAVSDATGHVYVGGSFT